MLMGRTPQGVRGLKPLRVAHLKFRLKSHSARSAWIETPLLSAMRAWRMSHSARSAWIETGNHGNRDDSCLSRTPQGVRGLKRYMSETAKPGQCRTPQGVRGLKPYFSMFHPSGFKSHSARSAWIETGYSIRTPAHSIVALRKECVD